MATEMATPKLPAVLQHYHVSSPLPDGESTTDLQPPSKKKKKEKLLFNFMEGVEEMNDESSGVEEIIDKYLAASCLPMDSDPSKFWKDNEKEYLTLAQMAKDILSMPASSAPVERLFSIAGRDFTPLRCSLKDDRFQQLMFIRCNNSFNAQNLANLCSKNKYNFNLNGVLRIVLQYMIINST